MPKFKGFDDDDYEYADGVESSDQDQDHRRERQKRRGEKNKAAYYDVRVENRREDNRRQR